MTPIYQVSRKAAKFVWTPDQQYALEALQGAS